MQVADRRDIFPHVAEGRQMAQEFGTTCMETSAKQRINVDEAFAELVRNIRKYTDVRPVCHLLCPPFASESDPLGPPLPLSLEQESSAKPVGGKDNAAAASSGGGGGHVPLKQDSHGGGCCGGCVIL